MKTIAFINQKGGVGKSTAALAVAEALTKDHSCKVLLIDLDPQCNLTYSFGASVKGFTAKSLLDGEANALEAVQKRPQGDVIPSNPKLAGADADYMMEIAKEHLLEDALKEVASHYDFCILDTPPALGTVTINALTAADYAVIPVLADIYSLQGVKALSVTMKKVKQKSNPRLKLLGLMLNKWNGRAKYSWELSENLNDMANQLGSALLNTKIRECVSIRKSQDRKVGIRELDPHGSAAQDFAELTKELLVKMT